MNRKRSQEGSQGEFAGSAEAMHERLWSWRRGEPGASFDEIMERVRQEREALMKPLVEELVNEALLSLGAKHIHLAHRRSGIGPVRPSPCPEGRLFGCRGYYDRLLRRTSSRGERPGAAHIWGGNSREGNSCRRWLKLFAGFV